MKGEQIKKAVICLDWLDPVKNAIPDPAERCAFWEYICAYFGERNYNIQNAAPFPKADGAKIAFLFVRKDIEAMCDKYAEMCARNQANGTKSKTDPAGASGGNNTPAGASGGNNTPAGASGGNNIIEYNIIKNNISSNAQEHAKEGKENFYFRAGINMLRSGYISPRAELDKFIEYCNTHKIQDYERLLHDWKPQTEREYKDPEKGARIADFLEGITAYSAIMICEVVNVEYKGNKIFVSVQNQRIFDDLRKCVRCSECAKNYINGREVVPEIRD